MSIQSHLAELEKKHQAFEAELADALAHPSVDDIDDRGTETPQVACEGRNCPLEAATKAQAYTRFGRRRQSSAPWRGHGTALLIFNGPPVLRCEAGGFVFRYARRQKFRGGCGEAHRAACRRFQPCARGRRRRAGLSGAADHAGGAVCGGRRQRRDGAHRRREDEQVARPADRDREQGRRGRLDRDASGREEPRPTATRSASAAPARSASIRRSIRMSATTRARTSRRLA